MTERKNAIVSLFTRFPNPPGSCKTRLIPTLGPRGATRCQTVMTERILDTLLGIGDIAVEVRYATSSNSDDDVRAAMDFWLSPRQDNDRLDYILRFLPDLINFLKAQSINVVFRQGRTVKTRFFDKIHVNFQG